MNYANKLLSLIRGLLWRIIIKMRTRRDVLLILLGMVITGAISSIPIEMEWISSLSHSKLIGAIIGFVFVIVFFVLIFKKIYTDIQNIDKKDDIEEKKRETRLVKKIVEAIKNAENESEKTDKDTM